MFQKRSQVLGLGAISLLALLVRIVWLMACRQEYGHDAIRYLWISEHVFFREWDRLPQLFTAPLLPLIVGMLSWLTGDVLWTGRIFSLLANTLAVILATVLMLRLIPERPILAWLTGLGLALNHVWASMAPFVMTDNLFFAIMIGLQIVMVQLLQKPSWPAGMLYGGLWALLYLTRDNGLYCGGVMLGVIIIAYWRQIAGMKDKLKQIIRVTVAISLIFIPIVSLWVYINYCTFNIVSLSESWRFYFHWVQAERQGDHPLKYYGGGVGPFRYRPYEYMEYTRVPLPDDARYPQEISQDFFNNLKLRLLGLPRNLHFAGKEVKLIILPAVIGLYLIFWGKYFQGLPKNNLGIILTANLILLISHLLALVRESRHIAWFFPWIYLGLSAAGLYGWDFLRSRGYQKSLRLFLSGLFVLAYAFLLLYPDYFKELPRKLRMAGTPHLYQLSSEYILKNFGPGAVISSRHLEIVYRSRGLAIGLPEGDAAEIIEWLYLGGADFLLFTNKFPRTSAQDVFWGDPGQISRLYPELELVAEFHAENRVYPQHGRLFRFRPDPVHFSRLQERYPWAGRRPTAPGSLAVPAR